MRSLLAEIKLTDSQKVTTQDLRPFELVEKSLLSKSLQYICIFLIENIGLSEGHPIVRKEEKNNLPKSFTHSEVEKKEHPIDR